MGRRLLGWLGGGSHSPKDSHCVGEKGFVLVMYCRIVISVVIIIIIIVIIIITNNNNNNNNSGNISSIRTSPRYKYTNKKGINVLYCVMISQITQIKIISSEK